MLSDVDFVQLKKQKMLLEIQLLEENILAQKKRSQLEMKILAAQATELESRTAMFEALTSVLSHEGASGITKLFRRSEP